MNQRTIRLFLSSTFRDFGEERDLLVKRVFPALRAKLRDRFVELVDVDLRWGITAEEAERGEVLPICLAEIDRARPYFIGMLGERYGWIPPSDGYAADLLERQPWLKKHQGGKSVTELEILHGVLNNRRMQGRAFFYFRSPAYARAKGGDYLPSAEDRARQTELKSRIRERGLPVISYANPEALAKRIERDLWKLLDAEFPSSTVPDAFERERLRHEAYAAPRRRLYLGGERYQRELQKLLDAEEPRIVVEGASGGGKSALLANFLEAYRKHRRRHLVHEHYLGASADAADPHALVRRLIEFIQRATGSTEEIPGDPQKLMDSLPLWLATASAWARRRRTRFIFVLDALSSLRESALLGSTYQKNLRWWPALLPKGVTILVSCLPGPVHDALKGKTVALPGQDKTAKWKTVTVRPLTKAQSATLLNAYLARFNKKLPRQMVKQVQAHALATNPLFLRTLAEELRLFGVHEELQKRLDHYLTSQTIDDLFEYVLQRVEKDCGRNQVKAVMVALWASRAGLTQVEILEIARQTPASWATVRNALNESFIEAQGRIHFAHDFLRKAVANKFLGLHNSGKHDVVATHKSMYHYFLSAVDPTGDFSFSGQVKLRGMDLLYHALMSADLENFERLIENPGTLILLIAQPGLSNDWEFIRRARDLYDWVDASDLLQPSVRLKMCEKVLYAISQLFMEMFGRHMRYCAGEYEVWNTTVDISENEGLGRGTVVAMAAIARWLIIYLTRNFKLQQSDNILKAITRLLLVSKTGALDDLDNYFAYLFRSRISFLIEFIRTAEDRSLNSEELERLRIVL